MKKQTKIAAGVGAGLAAATAAGLGYYFYASKNAKKNRRIAARWASGLKSDVVKQAKRIRDLDRDTVLAAVEKAAKGYEAVRGVDTREIKRAVQELKTHWKDIAKEAGASFGTKAKKKAKSRKRSR